MIDKNAKKDAIRRLFHAVNGMHGGASRFSRIIDGQILPVTTRVDVPGTTRTAPVT